MQLHGNRNVIDTHCSCGARCSKRCNHIHALLHIICNYRSTSKTSFDRTKWELSVTEISKKPYSRKEICKQLLPLKAEFNTDSKNAHKFTSENLKNVNCAAKEIVILKKRNKGNMERRSTLKRLNEQKNVIQESERIEACVKFFRVYFSVSKLYGGNFCFINDPHELFFTNHVALNDDQII